MIRRRKVNTRSNVNYSTNKIFDFSKMDLDKIYKNLDTEFKGLSKEEVERRFETYGLNELSHEKPSPWYIQLLKVFINPFILVLIVLAIVSLITDVILVPSSERNFTTVAVITIMVTLSGLLQFFQEFKSGKATQQLKALVKTTAAVCRSESGVKELNMTDIVPGDIVYLAAGDMIPADVRLITSKDLFISQSSLTGESEPVEKYATVKNDTKNLTVTDLDNICLLGTIPYDKNAAILYSKGEMICKNEKYKKTFDDLSKNIKEGLLWN